MRQVQRGQADRLGTHERTEKPAISKSDSLVSERRPAGPRAIEKRGRVAPIAPTSRRVDATGSRRVTQSSARSQACRSKRAGNRPPMRSQSRPCGCSVPVSPDRRSQCRKGTGSQSERRRGTEIDRCRTVHGRYQRNCKHELPSSGTTAHRHRNRCRATGRRSPAG